jgi:hypothetical protein
MRTQHFRRAVRVLAFAAGFSVAMPQVNAQRAGGGQGSGCPGDPAAEFVKCAMEKAKTFQPPRLPDGKPNFQGNWEVGRSRRLIEAHEAEGGQFGIPKETTLVVDPPDGKIPYTKEGAAKRNLRNSQQEALKTSVEFMDPGARCFSKGVPRMHMNNPSFFEFVQTPKAVFILHEQNHVSEIIPFDDGSARLSKNIKLWMGDERAHWEGDTLVVVATNHNGLTWIDDHGTPISADAKVTERYTLVDPDQISYSATIEDPAMFTRPWTMAFPLKRNKEKGLERMEFACHEGNKSNELQLAVGTK